MKEGEATEASCLDEDLPTVTLIPIIPKSIGRYEMADEQFVYRIVIEY